MVCPKCGGDMKVIAIVGDPDELRRILRHLVKIGRSPPGFAPSVGLYTQMTTLGAASTVGSTILVVILRIFRCPAVLRLHSGIGFL